MGVIRPGHILITLQIHIYYTPMNHICTWLLFMYYIPPQHDEAPLHVAAKYDHAQMISVFAAAKANLNIKAKVRIGVDKYPLSLELH